MNLNRFKAFRFYGLREGVCCYGLIVSAENHVVLVKKITEFKVLTLKYTM